MSTGPISTMRTWGRLALAPWAQRHLKETKTMQDQQLLERITLNPKVMMGKPVIKGTRLTVEYLLNLLAHGATSSEILAEYDGLTQEDIQACLLFAARALENTTFMPLVAEKA
jgi:uncharacterized protein (DUF433 family)